MQIDNNTNEIKWLTKSITNNFFKIGKILKEIRDRQMFKEKYDSFNQYLISNDFKFSRRHAYNFIKAYENYGSLLYGGSSVQSLHNITLTKLLQLTYVSDKELREEIIPETQVPKVDLNAFKEEVHRTLQRTDSDVSEIDDKEFKIVRMMNKFLDELKAFNILREDMRDRKIKLLSMSSQAAGQNVKDLRELIIMEMI